MRLGGFVNEWQGFGLGIRNWQCSQPQLIPGCRLTIGKYYHVIYQHIPVTPRKPPHKHKSYITNLRAECTTASDFHKGLMTITL